MKDVLSVSKKPAPQSHRSPKRPEKSAPKNARPSLPASAFLPTTRAEADARGWGQLDFVYVSGDAYVDHPSFGSAIITRVLESHGYKVGFIAQPDWNDPESIAVFGEPRLGFLVSAGNMDSMVNHYSVTRHRRKTDSFTPGGIMGKRPDYAVTVYCNLIRRTYRRKPIIIGGIEASLRRLAHYDYWSDKRKRSILLDSQADLLIYGMGERAVVEQQFVAVLQIPGQDRRDRKGFAERERIALAQRQRRGNRADAQLRTLQVDEQLAGNALRGLGAAQAFQPRRTLGEGTMGKVQAHAAHPRAQQGAQGIGIGTARTERAVELSGHGVSSLG